MQVIWVINAQAGSDASPLYEAIKKIQWLDGQVAIWTACEFKTMKKIRQFYREQHKIEKTHLYISSYWKKGLKEEELDKVAKREDNQYGRPHTRILKAWHSKLLLNAGVSKR